MRAKPSVAIAIRRIATRELDGPFSISRFGLRFENRKDDEKNVLVRQS
jgi:hypothetical protein